MDKKHNEVYDPTVDTQVQEKRLEGSKVTTRFKTALRTGVAILGLFAVTSCDSFRDSRDDLRGIDPVERELKEQIRQQKKEARYERRLDNVSYTLNVKIEQRKEWVAKYKEKLEECKADPDNRALKERTLQICQRVGEYNKEIKSLAKKELDITIKLDDVRSRPQSGLPTGPDYTSESYFDFLIQGKGQKCGGQNGGAITTDDVVAENGNGGENGNNSKRKRWQPGVTLEDGVRN